MYRIGICDDEINVCSSMERMITSFFKDRSEKNEIEVWSNSESMYADLEKFTPDILFLDIELPSDNGVEAGKYIREILKNDNIVIVYISHRTSYAMELFQVHPYDFLVKPIDKDLLYATITKILKLDEVQHKEFNFVFNKMHQSVQFGDILYFSSKNKTIIIHKRDGEELTFYGKLSDVLTKLPFQFASISKSFVVNIKYIMNWKSDSVTLENGIELPISQSHRSEFRKIMYNYTTRGGE